MSMRIASAEAALASNFGGIRDQYLDDWTTVRSEGDLNDLLSRIEGTPGYSELVYQRDQGYQAPAVSGPNPR
jgi:hypothetical protein